MKPSDAAIALEKALSFVNAANAQIDIVIIEKKASHGEKDFWNTQKRRLSAIVNDVMARIPKPESRDLIRREQADEFRIDALLSLFAQLNVEGRDELERYAKAMIGSFEEPQNKAA